MTYILYDYYAPAFRAGGPIQSLRNLMEALGKETELTMICSNRDVDGRILEVKTNVISTTKYGKVFYSNNVGKLYQQIKNGETLYINGIYSFSYNLLPILLCGGRKIISVRGMLTRGGLKRRWIKKKIYLAFLKLSGMAKRCEFHATNEKEAIEIRAQFGDKARIWIIPNIPKICTFKTVPEKKLNQLTLVTVALITGMKNHILVLLALKKCSANITYNIYGAVRELGYWNKCQEAIKQLPSNIKIVYHGEVEPELAEAAISQAHVYIQPSVSENFGHSLYEALAIGRPVVTSLNVPWQGLLTANAGVNVEPDDVDSLSEAITFFAEMDEQELRVFSEAARKYAIQAVNIEKTKAHYLRMFKGTNE